MKHFSVFEAKTHFLEILRNVMNGEKFIITKHGVQVAMIIPFTSKEEDTYPIQNTICALKKLRKGIILGKKLPIKKMIKKGRK